MGVRTYTTKQAGHLLGVNEMTVRRWAKNGRLPAARPGKAWLVDAAHVDRMVSASGSASRAVSREISRAVRKVVNGRRWSEWLPDGLQYLDIKHDPALLIRAVQHRLDTGDFEGREMEHIAVAKGAAAFRPGALQRLDDEVLYTLLVLRSGSSIERALDPAVFSYRIAHENDRELLKHQGKAWGEFQQRQRDAQGGPWTHVLVTDVAGFYEYVDPSFLADTLSAIGVPATDTGALQGMLKGWAKKTGLRGLPQGPDASAVLANAYLLPVDEQMLAECAKRGWQYIRWSDDVRVFTSSADDARTAGYLLSVAMRRRGLYLGPSKTEIVSVSELVKRSADDKLGHIAYLFDARRFDEVKAEIGPVFRRATRNYTVLRVEQTTELRFCLYRMGKTKDDRALKLVLQNLPDLGFLEVSIYLYLREFVARPSVVRRVVEVLNRLHPARDALLAGNLIRVLCEAESLDVTAMNALRGYAWGMSCPDAVRAVAIRAVGLHAAASDEADLKLSVWREADHRVIRATLAAIKDASPAKSNVTLGDYRRTRPDYALVVDYLMRFGAPAPRR